MAIFLEEGLPDVSAVGVPAKLVLETDGRVKVAGQPCILDINFGASRGPGDSFTLEYNGITLEFEFSGNDGSSLRFDGFSTQVEFETFFEAFKANFYIDRDFIATNPGGTKRIVLTARENGPAYDLIMTPLYSGSVEVQSGVDDDVWDNFSVEARIYARNDPNDAYVMTAVKGAIKGGTVGSNLGGELFEIYLDQILKSLVNVPTPTLRYDWANGNNNNFAEFMERSLVQWYAIVHEYKGDPPLYLYPYSVGNIDAPKYAHPFRLPKDQWQDQDDAWDRFFNGGNDLEFLNERTRMKVHKSQVVYPCNVVPPRTTGSPIINMDVTIYKTDGTTLDLTIANDSLAPNQYQMVAHAVDVAYILSLEPKAYKLELDIEGFWNIHFKTVKMTLEIDVQNYEQVHHIMYLGRGGAWETIYLTGLLQEGREYEAQEAQLESEYYDTDAQGFVYNKRSRKTYKLETGIKSKDDRLALAGLAESERVYYVKNGYTNDGELVPILMDVRSLEDLDNGLDDGANVELSWTNAAPEL